MKKVYIIHGCPSNKEKAMDPERRTYDKHWIPWLKDELSQKGIEAEAPLLPEPWEPTYENFKNEFEKNKIDEDTILIGHSCGGGFLVRWIDETKTKIKKLILVSPGKAGKGRDKWKNDLYGENIIQNLGQYVQDEIVIFTSNNDIQAHIKGAYEYEKELPAKVIFMKDMGHFVLGDMGTIEFPELLEEVLR